MAQVRGNIHDISDSEESDVESTNQPPTPSDKDLFSASDDLFDDEDRNGSQKSDIKEPLKSKSRSQQEKHDTIKVEDEYDADTDVDDSTFEKVEKKKPLCKYGSKCFRKNPSHLAEFLHPGKKREREQPDENVNDGVSKSKKQKSAIVFGDKTSRNVFEEFQPFSFFLTKVSGLSKQFNDTGAMSLRDILSPDMGQLRSSCHFNFMFDVPWLMKQYAEDDRKLPMLLVHGDQGRAEIDLKNEASPYPNISFCRARLDIPYGTHHTKMIFLLYKKGLRVVIHTANLISNDWHQKTQGIWISNIFPPCASSSDPGESTTRFKGDLLQYLAAYRSPKLTPWEKLIKEHDMSSANVHIVASVPGRHAFNSKHYWGHLKLKKILLDRGPEEGLVKNWPVVGQFSSIGSLGASQDMWLLSEIGLSLSQCKKIMPSSLPASKLHLIFPSKDNIRLSLEGYNGGGCVPYSIKTASKQPWLTQFFSQWKSEGRGRSKAVPHIKTYTRCSPDGSQAAWFVVTSANLSKAAWGCLEKKGSQLMIRSYEMGVLFLPADFGCKNSFNVSSHTHQVTDPDRKVFPLPYDLPPTTYIRGDRPWFCDVPCMDAPDTFGNMWCPPL